jgi:hypothetical protein
MVTIPLAAPMTTFRPQQVIWPRSRRLCGIQHIRRQVPLGVRQRTQPSLKSKSKAVLLPFEYMPISVEH